MNRRLLDYGSACIGLMGWHLFPVVGKVPATPHGYKDATKDLGRLEELIRAAPEATGLAVACGESGLVVLDIDVSDAVDGRASLREAGLPWREAVTLRASTPRGGEHVFFSGQLDSRTALLPGVDLKGRGGYVVIPGEPLREWIPGAGPIHVQPAPVPEWLCVLAVRGVAPPAADVMRLWETATAGYIAEGVRNETAASIAGHLLRRRVDPRLTGVLLVAWGRAFCDPPLEDREALRVFRSIAQREAAR